MTLQILHADDTVQLPSGWHTLATIQSKKKPEYSAWTLPLTSLHATNQVETWCVPALGSIPVSSKHIELEAGTVEWRYNADYALVWLQLNPSSFSDFQTASRFAWKQVLASMQMEHSQLLKVWHYLPGINEGSDNQERYRQFCVGRAQALEAADCQQALPAATAIGIPDTEAPLIIYWLLGRGKSRNIENPRQVSAWKYPRQYGPVSPNFSRATLDESSQLLLVSGTASVVGHATSHPYQTARQTNEMLHNLDALLATVKPLVPAKHTMQLRVYLRDKSDWSMVSAELQQAGFEAAQLLPLQGDICRSDLMVELDGYQFLGT